MLTEKEKLEEELKLLEESLSLKVVTPQEYENAKQRIESKLNDPGDLEQKKEETSEEKPEVREEGEIKEEPEVEKEEEKPEITEIKEENVKPVEEEKEEVIHKSPKEDVLKEKDIGPIKEEGLGEEETEIKEGESAEEDQKKLEEVKELSSESEKGLETSETFQKAEEKPEVREEGEIKEEPKPEEEQPESVIDKEKKSSKKIFTYIAVILFLVVGSWYLFFSGGSNDTEGLIGTIDEPVIACSSDNDCDKETDIGICNNPGTEDAECEYIKDAKVKLTVLNINDCFNCDTGRILSILKKNFPNLDITNTDFETEEGKNIVEKYNIDALPAYIFNSSFKEAYNYNKLSSGLKEVKGDFVMKNTVANANYYIGREGIVNKLDLFVKSGQTASKIAEDNLEEFLDVFEKNVDFEKYNVDSQIVRELGINSFPAFLINNKNKFSGVQSADQIRENFCQLNSVAECALGLTKSLV